MFHYIKYLLALVLVSTSNAQEKRVSDNFIRQRSIKVYSFSDDRDTFTTGSGTSIGDNRFITASHVLRYKDVYITALNSNNVVYPAVIVSSNPITDVAVLYSKDIIISSTNISNGYYFQPVLISGSRLGLSDFEVMRSKIVGYNYIYLYGQLQPVMITDGLIHFGYSGGGVFSYDGKLLGLVSGGWRNMEGKNYGSIIPSLYFPK